jgi:hypothetical protein
LAPHRPLRVVSYGVAFVKKTSVRFAVLPLFAWTKKRQEVVPAVGKLLVVAEKVRVAGRRDGCRVLQVERTVEIQGTMRTGSGLSST